MVLEGGKLQKDSDAKNSHSCCRQETWFGTHFRRVDALPFGDVDVLLISSLQVSPPRSSATSSSHMTIDTFHLFPQQDWFASPHRHISVFRLEAMTLDDGNVKEFHHLRPRVHGNVSWPRGIQLCGHFLLSSHIKTWQPSGCAGYQKMRSL